MAMCSVLNESIMVDTWLSSIAFHPHLPILATLGEKDTIIRIWELDEAVLLGQAKENVNYTTAKLVLVGNSGVGKTGLGWRLAHGEFKEHASTHGQQFWSIPELGLKRKDGTDCEAVLWDLAGQHVYRKCIPSIWKMSPLRWYCSTQATARTHSKGRSSGWSSSRARAILPTVLVGARIDRGASALSHQELSLLPTERHRGGYLRTSARDGIGIEELLET